MPLSSSFWQPSISSSHGMIFFDMQESGDIPGIAEMLFQGADAAVEFVPVMNADDLKNALNSL